MTKFTRDTFVGILNKIVSLPKTDLNKFVLFALDKNRQKLKVILDEITEKDKAIYSAEDFVNYEKARIEIIKKYAEKDSDGKVIENNGEVTIPKEFTEVASEDIKTLNEKFKTTLEKFESDKAELKKFLEEEIEVEFTKISFKHLPETFSDDDFNLYNLFIKETDEEIEALLG